VSLTQYIWNASGSDQVFIYQRLWSCHDSHRPEPRNQQLAAFPGDLDEQTVSAAHQPTYITCKQLNV